MLTFVKSSSSAASARRRRVPPLSVEQPSDERVFAARRAQSPRPQQLLQLLHRHLLEVVGRVARLRRRGCGGRAFCACCCRCCCCRSGAASRRRRRRRRGAGRLLRRRSSGRRGRRGAAVDGGERRGVVGRGDVLRGCFFRFWFWGGGGRAWRAVERRGVGRACRASSCHALTWGRRVVGAQVRGRRGRGRDHLALAPVVCGESCVACDGRAGEFWCRQNDSSVLNASVPR